MKFLNITTEDKCYSVQLTKTFSKGATNVYYTIETQLEKIFNVEEIEDYKISKNSKGELIQINWNELIWQARQEQTIKIKSRKYAVKF